MTTLREAAEQALEVLENIGVDGNWAREEEAVVALRTALEPVPVAWMDREGDLYKMPEIEGWAPPHTLLYTHPPQRKPLTKEEILKAWKPFEGNPFTTKYEFARAIEKAHGIGGEE
jgi:hypothetical protein